MAPAGLYAVLRSRRTYPPASQGKFAYGGFAGYLLLSLAQPHYQSVKFSNNPLLKAQNPKPSKPLNLNVQCSIFNFQCSTRNPQTANPKPHKPKPSPFNPSNYIQQHSTRN